MPGQPLCDINGSRDRRHIAGVPEHIAGETGVNMAKYGEKVPCRSFRYTQIRIVRILLRLFGSIAYADT